MEIRFLQPDEYQLLDTIPEEHQVKLDPSNTLVVGVIKDNKLKGRLIAINLPHIEAAWIDPEVRDGIVLARMESLIKNKLKELGVNMVLAFAVDEKMESYLKRLGYEKFATAWKKEI